MRPDTTYQAIPKPPREKGEITATRSHLGLLDCRELVSLAPNDAADLDRSPSRF